MERKKSNKLFRMLIRQIFYGLAAHERMEELDARNVVFEELKERGLLPTKSISSAKDSDREPNPIEYWRKGFVPGDRRVVDYLAQVGVMRAKLDEEWLEDFLRAAGYSTADVKAALAELSPGMGVLDNLPQYDATCFVGRHEELEKLRRLVLPKDPSSIIQIDGMGGVGKSELALRLAYEFRDNFTRLPKEKRFAAIVWITAKQEVLDSLGVRRQLNAALSMADVYSSVAEALDRPDIRAANERQRRELTYRVLSRQRTLLIIDNLDTDWSADLVSFIHYMPPSTKVVVTTRHRIDEPHRVHLDNMARDDALLLIGQEAELKNVVLSDEKDADSLYEATGGNPLAIKWCIGQMAFGQTIDAVTHYLLEAEADLISYILEKSVNLLQADSTAYELLLALALVAGDAPRAALGSMVGLEGDIPRRDLSLAKLERLSLVNRNPHEDRFSLLPLTRLYLRPRLEDSPELKERLFRGLVRYYQQRFPSEGSGPNRFWDGITHHKLVEQLEQEWVNVKDVLAQLHQAGKEGDKDLLTLGLPLVHMMNMLSLVSERTELCRWMIESARRLDDPVEAWLWMDGLGWMLRRARCYDEWRDAIDESRRVIDRHGGLELALILADAHEAYAHIAQGNLARAEELLLSAGQRLNLEEAGRSADPVERLVASRLSDHWFRLLRAKKEYAQALEWLLASLELRRSSGDELGSTYYYLGDLCYQQKNYTEARSWFQECWRTASHQKYPGLARYGLARVAEEEGNWVEAERQGREAVALLERRGFEREASAARALVERVAGQE